MSRPEYIKCILKSGLNYALGEHQRHEKPLHPDNWVGEHPKWETWCGAGYERAVDAWTVEHHLANTAHQGRYITCGDCTAALTAALKSGSARRSRRRKASATNVTGISERALEIAE